MIDFMVYEISMTYPKASGDKKMLSTPTLLLQVATTAVERIFYAINIIKIKLRNKFVIVG
jgi:hypothetical protein